MIRQPAIILTDEGKIMQVTETLSLGLKREYKVVLPAASLAAKLESQLAEMKDKVRINGFRPGKVPMAHLKRVYGKSIMSEVVQTAVNDANKKIVEDNGLRLALEPKVDFAGGKEEVEAVLEAKGDLAFTIALETLPKFNVGSFADVELERLVAEIPDSEVEAGVLRLANRNRSFTPREGDAPVAQKGDRVTIDFTGKLGDEPFEGGNGTAVEVILGSESFIPGFEQQIEGMSLGETRTISVKFPENYTAPKLAGQDATFDVIVKIVASPDAMEIDDAFAKGFNFEDLAALKVALRANLQGDQDKASRDKLKRSLLDALDMRYGFDLPEGLVEMEFANVWRQVSAEHDASGRSWEQDETTEEDQRAEYRRIAQRRVRLGLVLAEVGDKSSVQVTDQEVTQALIERARGFPGQEKLIWDHYSKNPQALAEIRAPIFEEKVIDHIISLAQVTDRVVSKEELFKMIDEDLKSDTALISGESE